MKKYLFSVFVFALSVCNVYALGSLQCTYTESTFCTSMTRGKYCCPNGTYQTSYSCPSGWSLSGTYCSRADRTLSDSTGTYVQSYSGCNATSKRTECCTVHASLPSGTSSADCSYCMIM